MINPGYTFDRYGVWVKYNPETMIKLNQTVPFWIDFLFHVRCVHMVQPNERLTFTVLNDEARKYFNDTSFIIAPIDRIQMLTAMVFDNPDEKILFILKRQ